MNLLRTMQDAGIYVSVDQVFQHHLRFGPECKVRARRFSKLQAMVRKRGHKIGGTYAARLVCLDLVAPADLNSALSSTPFSHNDKCYVDWKNHLEKQSELTVRVDRRELSRFTVLSFSSKEALDPQQETNALLDYLVSLEMFKEVKRDEVLAELFKDQCCWSTRNLSGPMWAHVTGLRNIWALDRTSLERRVTKRVPMTDPGSLDGSELAVAEFIDAAYGCEAGQTSGADRQIVDAALRVFTFSKDDDDSQTLARWLTDLLGLKEQIQHADAATAMVVSWMVDLVESGTQRKVNAKPQTRARYIEQLGVRLWTALISIKSPIQNTSELVLYAIYTSILADPSCTDKRGLSAAIGCFQSFAEEIWGMPFVPLNMNDYVVPALPRVQVSTVSNRDGVTG